MAARKSAVPSTPSEQNQTPEEPEAPEQEPMPEEPPAPEEPEAPEAETAANVRTGEIVVTPRTSLEAAYVDALRRERAGYVTYGREDRVATVDAELKRWGATAETD
ncbi:hypothetical protein Q5762_13805 [Streptomyces sp. P9(2023)]|uniref:hypothetical protein n=1 Tax=Streptomyces sp. P9(2023) TaxID=3064394 RepID=UPI0028F42E44|nr:hypothetical protein [Streptomyces sp. P9(2023)]MDT9689391.1 hypothetical protein [Streptomyces sp. P9(2023)]